VLGQKPKINRSRSSQSSAIDFVEAMKQVGLKVGMNRSDFELMLERMREQLKDPSVTGPATLKARH
jgi:hypothetical protein